MAFSFRPAVRENVPLLIGLAGGTGSGKTFTGMRMAKGIAGDRPFAVIDTEAGRAKAYADMFRFDHGDLKPPFRPAAYLEAIEAADKAGYPVIVVDSASHEHAGDGGLLDWHEEILQKRAGDDWQKREKLLMASWIEPKREHKRMVERLLQLRAHLILCFRAEAKIEMAKEGNKTVIREKHSLVGYKGWIPIAEKNLPFELTVFHMLLAEKPGVPNPIKLQEQHRHLFPADKPITEESGAALAEWARGGHAGKARTSAPAPQQAAVGEPGTVASPATWITRIKAAESRRDLEAISGQLKRAQDTLDAEEMTEVRAAYTDRWNALATRQSA